MLFQFISSVFEFVITLQPSLKILVISNAYPSERNHGFAVFMPKQVENLAQLGVQSVLVVKPDRARSAYVPFFWKSFLTIAFCSYDLVHAHFGFYSGLLPAIFKKRPLVITFHGSDAQIDIHRSRLYKALQVFVVKRADRLIAVSRSTADALVRDLGADPAKVSVISSGVRTDIFRPMDRAYCRANLGIEPNEKVVIFVGQLNDLKGVDLLFEAASRLSHVQFVLVGDGFLKHGPFNCRFLGPRPNEEIPELLCAADVLALPSRSEGTPVAILESFACGIPVVASRVGGIPDVVRDGYNGYLIEPGDVDALVDRLKRILEDTEKAQNMGMAGRELVAAHYDSRHLARRIFEVYQDLIGHCSQKADFNPT